MTEYRSPKFPIEGNRKKIEKSLEFILPIYDFHETYVFNDNRKVVNDNFNPELFLPYFSFKDFSSFVEWFTLFEGLAKERNFSTTTIFIYINHHLSNSFKTFVLSEIINKYNVTNMLELGCALTNELFAAEEICRAQKRFLQAIESEDKEIIIYSIYQICTEMVIACLAFNHVCPISEVWLIDHICMELPQSVLTSMEQVYPAMFEMKLAEFLNALKVHWRKGLGVNINLDAICFKRKKLDDDEDSDSDFYSQKLRCACCGERGHSKSWCPIKNIICENCLKKGHMTHMCKYFVIRDNQNNRKGVAALSKKKIVIIFDKKDAKLKNMEKKLTSIQKQLKQLLEAQKKSEQGCKREEKKNKKTKQKKKQNQKKRKEKIKEKNQKKKEKKLVTILGNKTKESTDDKKMKETSASDEMKSHTASVCKFYRMFNKEKSERYRFEDITINDQQTATLCNTESGCSVMSQSVDTRLRTHLDPIAAYADIKTVLGSSHHHFQEKNE